MKRPAFIARQSGHPNGMVGRLIAWIMARETAALNQRALEHLSLEPSDRVLEVGFGHGRTIEKLAAAIPNGHVAGVDVSQSMTKLALRRNRVGVAEGRIDLRHGDGARLPFADAAFDKALTVHTIYFWPDPAACLRELRRVLRPRARLAIGFTAAEAAAAADFPPDVYTFYTPAQISNMLRDAGFQAPEITPIGSANLAVVG